MALYALLSRALGVRSAAQSHSTDLALSGFRAQPTGAKQRGLVPKIKGGWGGPGLRV